MATGKSIRAFFLEGPAGRLEALLNAGRPDASHAAVVCHPHPLFGGTMHNKVVFHAMKALNSFGFPVLRFNFRGAGKSAGEHDQGRGEVDDVRAALDWLDKEFGLPLIFAGFSFGAAAGMEAACPDKRVRVMVALGMPVRADDRSYSYEYLAQCRKAKLFLSGSEDEFAPRAELERIVATAAQPKELVLVAGGDHFFAGKLERMRAELKAWIEEQEL